MTKKVSHDVLRKLKQQILVENQLLIKNRKMNRMFLGWFGLFVLLSLWLFSGGQDALVKLDAGLVAVLKWVFAVLSVVTFLLFLLGLYSYRVAKKRVIYLIDVTEGKQELK